MTENIHIDLKMEITDDQAEYLRQAARIRRLSRNELLRRMLYMILRDQLFLSILDDNEERRFFFKDRS